jgi:hypothetical protein
MKTERTLVTGNMYVFAKAKSEYQLGNLKENELPFDYVLKSYDFGDEDCVRIHEFPVQDYLPEGIDITLKCVENLQEQIIELEKKTKNKVKELTARIRALALIEHQPSD